MKFLFSLLPICFSAFAALAQLIIGSSNTPYYVNFSNFSGGGFSPSPSSGQLNSSLWSVRGLSDGNLDFDSTRTTDDFARGVSTGGVSTGGIYGFDIGSDTILGIQPTAMDCTPGHFVIRMRNSTGAVITDIDVGYYIWSFNDENRSLSVKFSHSYDDTIYSSLSSMDAGTAELADSIPVWKADVRGTTISGLNVGDGKYFFIRWTVDDSSGSGSRDEAGINNITVLATTSTEISETGPGGNGLMVYPNPFAGRATIVFFSEENPGNIVMKVYDLMGNEVVELYNGSATKQHRCEFVFPGAGRNIPCGTYIAVLSNAGKTIFEKIMFVK